MSAGKAWMFKASRVQRWLHNGHFITTRPRSDPPQRGGEKVGSTHWWWLVVGSSTHGASIAAHSAYVYTPWTAQPRANFNYGMNYSGCNTGRQLSTIQLLKRILLTSLGDINGHLSQHGEFEVWLMADNGRQEGDSIRFSVLDLLKPVQANMYLKRTWMSTKGWRTPSKKIIYPSVDFVPTGWTIRAKNLNHWCLPPLILRIYETLSIGLDL